MSKRMSINTAFARFAAVIARMSGSPIMFGAAALVIVVWAISGPWFGFSETWQLVINTGTTIITFLMVFIIQNTQNRESLAVQIKLDELIRAMRGAENAIIDLENEPDEELSELKQNFAELGSVARHAGVRRDQEY